MSNPAKIEKVPKEMLALYMAVATTADAPPPAPRLLNVLAGLVVGKELPPDLQERLDANAMTCRGGDIKQGHPEIELTSANTKNGIIFDEFSATNPPKISA